MAITASVITARQFLADGRSYVTERHTDQDGILHVLTYLAEAATDVQAILTARATSLFADLVDLELARNLRRILERGASAQLTFHYCTAAQMRTYARDYYRTASQLDVCMMAQFLLTLTDTQLKNIFSVNDAQLVTLKGRLQSKADAATTVTAAAGE
jgi:hypothetical protein